MPAQQVGCLAREIKLPGSIGDGAFMPFLRRVAGKTAGANRRDLRDPERGCSHVYSRLIADLGSSAFSSVSACITEAIAPATRRWPTCSITSSDSTTRGCVVEWLGVTGRFQP